MVLNQASVALPEAHRWQKRKHVTHLPGICYRAVQEQLTDFDSVFLLCNFFQVCTALRASGSAFKLSAAHRSQERQTTIRRLAASCLPSAASRPALTPRPATFAPHTFSPSCKVNLLAAMPHFDFSMTLFRIAHKQAKSLCGPASSCRPVQLSGSRNVSSPNVGGRTSLRAWSDHHAPAWHDCPLAHAVAKSVRPELPMKANTHLSSQA